ncbi:MAG: hypothetical protein ACD_79C00637G0002 [uncultured bacterium]|nr:MAG: hypothetical protein ACD_79C00637G0002 [uncultured bacterium]
MKVLCPHCNKNYELEQKYPYHSGFSNRGFIYCNACPTILEFSSYNKFYTNLSGNKHPWMLTDNEKLFLESHLKTCPCGGNFQFEAKPRCLYCNGLLNNLLLDNMHYVEIETIIDADIDINYWI